MDKWGLYDESYKIAADSDLLVRYLYEADLKVYYLNKYIVKMRMGGLSTDAGKSKQKWAEDLRMYKSHGTKFFQRFHSSLKPDCRGVKYRKQRKRA